ncbi:unnamed protein product [Closterium sp. NIES-53]
MDTSSKGAKTYTARLGERILWDLHEDRDVYNEMWQIPVVPMPKERQVAASISTKGEAVGSGDGANGSAKEMKSKKCNLGGTSKLGEHEESGAAAQKQHKVKNEMVAGIRVKGVPDEVLGCPTCMQAKFTRCLFSSSEATAKAPLDEVVMDVVGPLKLGAAGAEYFLTIVDVYTRITWVGNKTGNKNLMYKDWKAENEAKIGIRFGEVKSSGLEHVELPLELSSSSIITRQFSLVNGGEEAKDAEEEEEKVPQVSERAPTLPSRTTSAPRMRVTPQQRQGLHVPAAEQEGRGKRRIQAPNRLTYDALGKTAKSALVGAALIVGDDEESDYEECAFAFFSPSIEENGTWELVELPEGRKAITSKWLFKIKSDADGKIERYKSRLVAKGYQQKEKVDYKELFAPVVKPTMLRTLLAGAAIKGWVVKQMDVTTAFLNGCHSAGRERYFLLVVDDYTRYTTVFLLRNKVQIRDVLIPCIRAVRLQLYERFRQDFPILRLHSERGGEFSSDLLQKFRRGEGILHSFTLPASPQKNGIAERRISLVMEVARVE